MKDVFATFHIEYIYLGDKCISLSESYISILHILHHLNFMGSLGHLKAII